MALRAASLQKHLFDLPVGQFVLLAALQAEGVLRQANDAPATGTNDVRMLQIRSVRIHDFRSQLKPPGMIAQVEPGDDSGADEIPQAAKDGRRIEPQLQEFGSNLRMSDRCRLLCEALQDADASEGPTQAGRP